MKNKKYIKLICAAVLTSIAVMAGGCSKDSDETNTTTTAAGIGNTNVDNTNVNTDENARLDLTNYSLEYDSETDAMPGYVFNHVSESEYGYYMWSADELIMFLDKETMQYVPLCSKPNCEHDSDECSAYFRRDTVEKDEIQSFTIIYNSGYVYIIGMDTDEYMCLYRVAEDGSSKEKYMRLYKANVIKESSETGESREINYPEVCIHRGYVYFIINKESEMKVRRIKLGGEEVEEIFSMTGERQNLYRLEPYGDYIFFQAGNFIDDNYIDIEGGIMAYNVNTGEISMVKKGAISSYFIRGNDIYYTTADGINVYSMDTMTDTVFVNNLEAYPYFGLNDEYVFVYDDSELKIYGEDGKIIRTVTDERLGYCYMGNQLIFAEGTVADVRKNFYFDTTDINNAEWMRLNLAQ